MSPSINLHLWDLVRSLWCESPNLFPQVGLCSLCLYNDWFVWWKMVTNSWTLLIHHQYVQYMAWYNANVKLIPFCQCCISANIHWWISIICCENVRNYLIMGLKIFKTLQDECRSLDLNQLSAIISILLVADLSLSVQKVLAFTSLLGRHEMETCLTPFLWNVDQRRVHLH